MSSDTLTVLSASASYSRYQDLTDTHVSAAG